MIAVLSVDRSGDLHLNEERVSQLQYAVPETGGTPGSCASRQLEQLHESTHTQTTHDEEL